MPFLLFSLKAVFIHGKVRQDPIIIVFLILGNFPHLKTIPLKL